MLKLMTLLILTLLPTFALAMGGGEHGDPWKIFGFYGLGSVSPSDLNNSPTAKGTVPILNNVTSNTLYGGGIGYMFHGKWELRAVYDVQDAKNPTNTTIPVVSGAGFELLQNNVWAVLNYHFIQNNSVSVYAGAGAGYSVYSHVKYTSTTNLDYDADKNVGFIGQAGIDVRLGKMFSVFFEGAYQSLAMGTLKTSTGATILTSSGGNAKMDMSGVTGKAGLALHF